MRPPCTVEGCPHWGYPICWSHRWRLSKYGDVLADIPLGQLRRQPKPRPPQETELEIAMAPAPAAGHGLLWLV